MSSQPVVDSLRISILKAAMELMQADGSDFSLRQLERHVGIASATRARIFGTRDSIFAGLLGPNIAPIRERFERRLDDPDKADVLVAWIRSVAQLTLYLPGTADGLIRSLVSPASPLHPQMSDLALMATELLHKAYDERRIAHPYEGAILVSVVLSAVAAADAVYGGGRGTQDLRQAFVSKALFLSMAGLGLPDDGILMADPQ